MVDDLDTQSVTLSITSEPSELTEPLESIEEASNPSESVNPSKAVEPSEPSESVDPSEAIEPSEPLEWVEPSEPSESVNPSEVVEPSEPLNASGWTTALERFGLRPPSIHHDHPIHGDPSKFTDVLYSCVASVNGAHGERPLCGHTLQNVTQADVDAFRKTHPDEMNLLEERIASAMNQLSDSEHYRSLGLYTSLLMQDIDLLKTSDGPLTRGAVGEATNRYAAVVRQGMSARDERRLSLVPTWAIIVMAVLGVLLLAALIVVGMGCYLLFVA